LNYNALRWSVAVNFAIQSSLKQSFHAIARLMDSKLCSFIILHIFINKTCCKVRMGGKTGKVRVAIRKLAQEK
jgi:transposase